MHVVKLTQSWNSQWSFQSQGYILFLSPQGSRYQCQTYIEAVFNDKLKQNKDHQQIENPYPTIQMVNEK
jgi:hypothetical protein